MKKTGKRILKKLSKRLISLATITITSSISLIVAGEPAIPEHLSEQSNK